jgi:hypothetical protein
MRALGISGTGDHPVDQREHSFAELATGLSQAVLDARRHLRMRRTQHKAIRLQGVQGLRKHLVWSFHDRPTFLERRLAGGVVASSQRGGQGFESPQL